MPSEKEIEEIIERIKSGKMMSMDDEDSLIDAYLSMKSERDKYKDIVEAVKSAHREYADDGRVWLECRDIDKALSLCEKES